MADNKPKQYGVYQKPKGSYKFGTFRFAPGAVVEVPSEIAKTLDSQTSPDVPVKFFGTPEKAAAEAARLKEKFAAQKKKE
ncbi:MAG: hypothetical protein ACM3ZB_07065 [bacterium]